MRLIDLDELLKYPIRLDHFDTEHGNIHFVLGIESVIEYAESLPIVDAEPTRHGKWVSTNGGGDSATYWYECSNCGGAGGVQDRHCELRSEDG